MATRSRTRVSGPRDDERRAALLEAFADRLATAPLNLVSRRDRNRVASLHIPESALVAQRVVVPAGGRIVDLGSGGGLPGVVMAVCLPAVEVLCLDARSKKMAWLSATCAELGISNVTARAGRAEDLARAPDLRGTAAVVVSRALASVPVVAELARGFLVDGGELVVVKGADPTGEVSAATRLAPALGYAAPRIEPLTDAPRPTTLVRARALGAAPGWVPRPDGQPQRDPLDRGLHPTSQDDAPR